MKTKTFEVRDRGTFLPVLCVQLEPETRADRYLLARSGYGLMPVEQGQYILCMRLDGGSGRYECDWREWRDNPRTIPVAHKFIIENWEILESGVVVDVEFILGEKQTAKVSESEDPRSGGFL